MRLSRLGANRTVYVLCAVALVSVVMLRADSAVTQGGARNSHVRGVVLFVGDSNITRGAQHIDEIFTWLAHNDNGYVPVMASRVGATIRTPDCLEPEGCVTTDYWKTRLVELFQRVKPDVVVSNLGINDTVSAGTETTPGYAEYANKIDWFMSLIPRDTPVFWTNLPCPIEPARRATGCAEVNEQLSRAPARWPNLSVLDWNSTAGSRPDFIASPGTEIHYSATGLSAWTHLVVNALDERFSTPS